MDANFKSVANHRLRPYPPRGVSRPMPWAPVACCARASGPARAAPVRENPSRGGIRPEEVVSRPGSRSIRALSL